ncbi:PleD family two-component system response regulator [Elioraea rosea]|uniref:PleD family two-component system response regulator n=1 Tax=Elioraea rosea TaxID=2492390 RepID=UPI001182083D|nr:PleD family two-component system response regulator [Elioraea rosea]
MSARILVVDDVLANLRLLEAKLAAEYYEVLAVQDGQRALEAAHDWAPDLVLLDVMMPGMDGFEVCRRLKADRATEHVPVVMVTALGETTERVRGLEAGADDFLTKPVDDETLLARVRSLVRLKRLLDEWRLRAETTHQLGVGAGALPPSVRGARALVVDDNPHTLERIAEALAAEGIDSTTERSAAAGFERITRAPVDIVIVSMLGSEDDPLRFASRLRADATTREVPLVLIADEAHMHLLHRAFELGANDYIVAPIDPNELRVRARNQIRRKLYQDRLRADLAYSISLALTDPLTGLHNQRYLRGHLRSLIGSVRSAGGAVSALMIDLDHFKRINDQHGHPVGDAALRLVAGCIRGNVRLFDTVARYGGEEFVVVMPGANMPDAMVAAERLRGEIARLAFRPGPEAPLLPLTASIGLATLSQPADFEGDGADERLLQMADAALYEAKRAGRNRVATMPGDTGAPATT